MQFIVLLRTSGLVTLIVFRTMDHLEIIHPRNTMKHTCRAVMILTTSARRRVMMHIANPAAGHRVFGRLELWQMIVQDNQ